MTTLATTSSQHQQPGGLAPWQVAWRFHIAPVLSDPGLKELLCALDRNDARLLQDGKGWRCVGNHLTGKVRGACAIAWCWWHGDGCDTGDKLDQRFLSLSRDIGFAAMNSFTDWFDTAERDLMRSRLATEVRMELRRREEVRR